MENYFRILTDLKNAILEDNIAGLKQVTTKLIQYTCGEKNQITWEDFRGDARNPIRKTNLVILASKYNRVNILEYLFDPDTIILNNLSIIRTILPDDEDEEHHNAFYYAIRWSNSEVLGTLMNKWPDNYFAGHLEKLDEILSRAYEELQLKNVPLSNEIEIFVEQKLINLRFFSNDDNVAGDVNNTQGRINLMIENITLLKKDYSKQEKVDGRFLFIVKFIAQNMHILKQQLKSTYNTLPWEKMEFCLVSFVFSHIKKHEINFFFRATLNKSKILKYLENFAEKLQERNNIIKGSQRAVVVAEIIKNLNPFEELYKDYDQIRDVYSLEKINASVKLALSADPNEPDGRLIITRVLQVIGENVKNTLGSPNLSNATGSILLLSLPKNTRQIISGLRDSLSHSESLSKRMAIEENPDINCFINIQNDIKKVGDVINDILFKKKIETARTVFETISKIFLNDENLDDIIDVREVLRTVESDKMSTYKMLEHERLEHLLKELNNNITEKTEYEKGLLDEIDSIINSVVTRAENNRNIYYKGFGLLQSLTLILTDDNRCFKNNKSQITEILQRFTMSEVDPKNLKKISNLLQEIYYSVESRMEEDQLDDTLRLLSKIHDIAFETGDIKWIEELKEKLNKQGKTSSVTDGKYTNDQLKLKLSKLETILSNYTVNGSLIIEKLVCYKKDSKIQAVVEMLVLDIMSILDSSKLENNLLLLDDHTPLLIGRSLRNHLAHDNALFNVLSPDPLIAVILNAENLTEENLNRSTIKIGKVISDDISKLEAKYEKCLLTFTNQEKMFVASEEENPNSLENCLKTGADINARSFNLWTTLHFAAKGGSLEVVKFIHAQNVNVNLTDNRGQTPLHIAAAYGWKDIVEYFIKEARVCVNVRNDIDRTPLHVAAQNGHKNIVQVLLKNEANTVTYDVEGRLPLHYAIGNDHIDIAKILLEKDVSVDINKTINKKYITQLHEAVLRDNLKLVNFLLSYKAEVNSRIDLDCTPLHVAAQFGHEEIVNALILKGADVNARSMHGCSALYYAVQNGHKNVAKILLLYGANVDATEEHCRSTPLHSAARSGYLGIVKTLLTNKANAYATTVEGTTALHDAVVGGHLDIVAALLEHGVDIHAKNKCNYTPLQCAAACGHKEIADLLITKIGKLNANNNYLTTIHTAAMNGHKDVVALLIENNAEVNARDVDGYTALHAAASNGNQDMIELVIKYNAEVNAKTNDGTTPLHIVARNGHRDAVNFLINNEGEVNTVDNDKIAPLHVAVLGNHEDVVRLLIEYGAVVDATDANNWTPLSRALIEGHKEVAEILLTHGANIHIEFKNCNPLRYAVIINRIDIVELLIEKGANVNEEVDEALLLAVLNGNTDIVNMLLVKRKGLLVKRKACVNVRNDNNETLLHIAAKRGHIKIVNALINSRADVESVSTNNVTPLFLAVQGNHEVVVTSLIKRGANVNVRCAFNMTPLHLAAGHGHINVVQVLLDNPAIRINVKDNEDRIPIEYAVENGHLEVVKMLLKFNKEIIMNAKGKDDFTLLHIASKGSNLELIKCLVAEGFDIKAKNALGSKPIHIAATEGYEDTVEYFFSEGLSINDTDAIGQSLLHCAASNGHLEVVKYLIAQGADVNAKTAQGLTAMHIAAKFGCKAVIEVLLQYGAIYNAVDESHRTSSSMAKNTDVTNLFESTDKLFEAAERNNSLEVEDYIKAGAFVNAKNVECETPLYYAVRKGYHKVLNVLLKNNANPNVVGNKGYTTLHYAAELSHLKNIKALLSNYAVYNAVSEDGKTPLDLTADEDITNLFKLVNGAFEDIKNGNSQVIDDLNKITEIGTLKAVMCACDRENRTLVVAAMQSNFSQVDQLKEISQGDLSIHITEALLLMHQGNYQIALSVFESAWEKRKEILGSDNPGTLDIQTYIATVLYMQGDYSKAINILEEILHKQTKILGVDYEDTLSTAAFVALIMHKEGVHESAFNLYQAVYQRQKEILGPDHMSTLASQKGMAGVLSSIEKYEEALKINQDVFQITKETWGNDHIITLQAQNEIAIRLANLRKFEEALKMFKEIYKKRKEVLGVDHIDTLETLHNIGGMFIEQGNTHEALKAIEQVLNNQEKFPENHPVILSARSNMAYVLYDQGDILGAYKAYKEILVQMERVLESSNQDVLNVLKMIEKIDVNFFKHHGLDASKVLDNLQNNINIAARNGDIQTVQRLLENGADPNEKDIDSRTPLNYAVSYGHLSVLQLLLTLQYRADITRATDKVNTTLLHNATAEDCKEIVDVLLQHVSRDKLKEFINAKTTVNGDTSLHLAVNNGSLHIIKSVLKRGAIYNIKNNNGKTPLDLSKDHEYSFLKLVEDLFEDAKNGNVQIIGKLRPLTPDDFKAVTNVCNNEGNTLLQVAVANEHKNIAKDLLEMLKMSDQGEQDNTENIVIRC